MREDFIFFIFYIKKRRKEKKGCKPESNQLWERPECPPVKLDHGVSLEEESAKAFHVDKGPCRHLVAPFWFLMFYSFLFLLSVKASDVGQCLSFCVFDLGVSVFSYFQWFCFCFWTNLTDVLFVPQWGDYVTSRVRPGWWGSPEHQGGRRWYHWGGRKFEIVIIYYLISFIILIYIFKYLWGKDLKL